MKTQPISIREITSMVYMGHICLNKKGKKISYFKLRDMAQTTIDVEKTRSEDGFNIIYKTNL